MSTEHKVKKNIFIKRIKILDGVKVINVAAVISSTVIKQKHASTIHDDDYTKTIDKLNLLISTLHASGKQYILMNPNLRYKKIIKYKTHAHETIATRGKRSVN